MGKSLTHHRHHNQTSQKNIFFQLQSFTINLKVFFNELKNIYHLCFNEIKFANKVTDWAIQKQIVYWTFNILDHQMLLKIQTKQKSTDFKKIKKIRYLFHRGLTTVQPS